MSETPVSSAVNFSDEQSMLLDTAVEFFRDTSPMSYVRSQLATETGFAENLWREMVDLGWLGLAVPEAYGGSGLGLAEAVSIAEPMGRHLCNCPFLSCQMAIQVLLAGGDEQQRGRWLPRLAQGAIASVAVIERDGDWSLVRPTCSAIRQDERIALSGVKTFAVDAGVAELLVVSVEFEGEPALVLLENSGLPEGALTRQRVIDETRRSFRLDLDGIEADAADLITSRAALGALAAIRDTALLLITAEACGGTAGVLDVIVDYLNTRTQFGRLIGSYQALKHPAVDILIGLERARSHLYHAASVIGDAELALGALGMAKAQACDAFAYAGDRSIQFHGAFGFTYECDAQLFLRRALWCQYQFGDALHHRKHLADLLL
ncbi:MAG: acyl-CoA/acyl-ACP dehydrogenase [Gammaproteobacteria bacterium]|nr:acyl-CoA/acyl-ACP dehydrogenase [Gammaproteobacteria bacterium]